MKTAEQRRTKLFELGFSPSHLGFNAILKVMEVWQPGEKIVAAYAIAGKQLGTTGSRVERNIRTAIEKAMLYNHKAMTDFMLWAYDPRKGYPTSHEFLSVLWYDFNASTT